MLTISHKKLRVSSHILKTGSRVFKALLGPAFGEGHTLAQCSSIEFPLPDDTAECMLVIWNVMHMRHADLRYDGDPTTLYKTCDKYDVVQVLAPWAHVWLERELNRDDGSLMPNYLPGLHRLFAAALGFIAQHSASSIARRLLKHAVPGRQDVRYSDIVPEHLCSKESRNASRGQVLRVTTDQLDDKRKDIRTELYTYIEAALEIKHSVSASCGAGACRAPDGELYLFMNDISSASL